MRVHIGCPVKTGVFPLGSWASSDDVWIKMLNKELKYVHDKGFLQQHPKLKPKMRAILLDWLLEVHVSLKLLAVLYSILGLLLVPIYMPFTPALGFVITGYA